MPKWPRLEVEPWVYYIHLVGLIWNGGILIFAYTEGVFPAGRALMVAFFLLVVIFTVPQKDENAQP